VGAGVCPRGALQLPADCLLLDSDSMAATFREFWHTPQLDAVDRMKLHRLAWDLVGTEFAGRHQQSKSSTPEPGSLSAATTIVKRRGMTCTAS
jgi:4-hydroxyphenylacetate 3-monooxygenase